MMPLRERIERLNEHTDWAVLIQIAQANLEKDDILRELSCAWSTVTRWAAGHTRPGPAARTAIKQKLLTLAE